MICEVKNRVKKFSIKEAEEFYAKMILLKEIEMEKIEKAIGFVFSITGFSEDALKYLNDKKIAWSEDDKWLL